MPKREKRPRAGPLDSSTKNGTMKINRNLKRLPAHFYRLDSGREPVREWLKSLGEEDRKTIGEDIKDVEFSWPIGMPLVRALGDGLWEIRSNLSHGRIGRVLFCIEHEQMILLHGFIKKTQKTPQHDIDLALGRKKGTA
jgi:phage-related protein